MMTNLKRRLSFFLVAGCVGGWGSVATADPPKEGDVLLIARDATELREKDQVVARMAVGSEFTVQSVKGDWIGGVVRMEDQWRTGWVKPDDLIGFDDALKSFEAQLQTQPTNYHLLLAKARLLRDEEKYAEALATYDRAIQIRPDDKIAFRQRGYLYYLQDEHAKAITDCNRALQIDSRDALALTNRGMSLQAQGRYAEAIKDYELAIKLADGNALAMNNAAWIWATCPDAKLRNGKQAIESAEKACELTGYSNFDFLDTLAAAHAEDGGFEFAAECLDQAIALAPKEYHEELQGRQKLYKMGKPYRDELGAPK
jgi:tetratricopeptide (TPR) repeat protein